MPAESPSRAASPWHTFEVDKVIAALGSNASTGLTTEEAAKRLAQGGPNSIREKPPRSSVHILFNQFADFMILVLIAAAAVSGIVGDLKDTLAIAVIVLLTLRV